ncbi:hypothetical protein MRX96_046574 [Rhipicephalus microplus]
MTPPPVGIEHCKEEAVRKVSVPSNTATVYLLQQRAGSLYSVLPEGCHRALAPGTEHGYVIITHHAHDSCAAVAGEPLKFHELEVGGAMAVRSLPWCEDGYPSPGIRYRRVSVS